MRCQAVTPLNWNNFFGAYGLENIKPLRLDSSIVVFIDQGGNIIKFYNNDNIEAHSRTLTTIYSFVKI
jgi:endo-1,4-beta-D-glucanase Y